jgi:hypothetical protein
MTGAFRVRVREIFEFLSLLWLGVTGLVVEDGLLLGVENEGHRILLNIISFYSICNNSQLIRDGVRQIGF